MDERMVQDLLKEGLAFLKEQSVLDFIKNDQAYQESIDAHGKLKKVYEHQEHAHGRTAGSR